MTSTLFQLLSARITVSRSSGLVIDQHIAHLIYVMTYEANRLPQAMAIVNERHNAAKPTQVDPKTGRPLPPAVPPRAASPSLDLPQSDQGGFFGSFFAPKNKKKMAAMDSPPPQLKASGTLSEKEANEVEVISKYRNMLGASLC